LDFREFLVHAFSDLSNTIFAHPSSFLVFFLQKSQTFWNYNTCGEKRIKNLLYLHLLMSLLVFVDFSFWGLNELVRFVESHFIIDILDLFTKERKGLN